MFALLTFSYVLYVNNSAKCTFTKYHTEHLIHGTAPQPPNNGYQQPNVGDTWAPVPPVAPQPGSIAYPKPAVPQVPNYGGNQQGSLLIDTLLIFCCLIDTFTHEPQSTFMLFLITRYIS